MTIFQAKQVMGTLAVTLAMLASIASPVSAQGDGTPSDAAGIKAANLVGAEVALMHEHSVEVAQSKFDLLEGFDINLFAAEPMLANPVHMTWAPDGKLWVACSWAYPQLKPGETPNDKIIVLEDVDKDGQADNATVFADGLYIPTGITLSRGGCYVAQTPDVLFLKDTDGDGKADVREVALSGFGIEDSHHSISAWRRGPGGWIYFQEGRFLNTQVETQFGVVRNYDGGVYQFNPRTMELRIFAKIGVGNPWGHVFDDWGQSFLIDNPRVSYLTPSTGNSGIKTQPFVLEKTEKQCGGDLISGTHFPADMRGQLVTCRFKSRALIRHEFHNDRSGFGATVLPAIVRSRHPNFRPVDCKIGPDGALYVADWYNSIINHGQHDFRDPRRDADHGRIWRITAKERPLVTAPVLAGASLPELLDNLTNENSWTRNQARLEISERNPDSVQRVVDQWLDAPATSELESRRMIEGLWVLQSIERPNENRLRRALQTESGEARAAAARVLRYWHAEVSNPAGLIRQAANDPFSRVRLEGVLSAGFVPGADSLVAALEALDHPRDPYIDSALEQTAIALTSFITDDIDFAKPSHRDFAMQHAGLDVDRRLTEFMRAISPPADEAALLADQFARAPTARTARLVATALTKRAKTISPQLARPMLDALRRIGHVKQFNLLPRIEPLAVYLDHADPAVALAAIEVLGAWKAEQTSPRLFSVVDDSARPIDIRRAAAHALGTIRTPDGTANFMTMSREHQSPETRSLAIHGLVSADLNAAAKVAADVLSKESGASESVAIVTAFLNRRGGATKLARELSRSRPHAAVAITVVEWFNTTGQLTGRLAEYFRPVQSVSLAKELLDEDVAHLADDAQRLGNAGQGELIFRRKSLACASCHGIGRVGADIGPDLAAAGSAATMPYFVESILRPDKAIAEHYETTVVILADGRSRSGILKFQNEQKIVLHDPQVEQPVSIPRPEIDEMVRGVSLMPNGLADRLASRQEFLDLVKFVSQLGRSGAYATSSRPLIRRWSVAVPDRDAPIANVVFSDDLNWRPAYSLVSGELPADELGGGRTVLARGAIRVHKAGLARLEVNSTGGVRFWLDAVEISNIDDSFALAPGQHTLTFVLEREPQNATGLRAEVLGAAPNPATLEVIGGR